ncbi:MAG: RimK/LysX family protein [Hyphomicrobiaceae bacterium]|nr:RimK/LysX family protein [Hyphomicrobiaceae bacterium]
MTQPLMLGWEEWVSLPGLGLPAIKAKVDTGARTSALHAHMIEAFGPAHAPMVRFSVHPIPRKTDVVVTCSAAIVDRRDVTSSNGETEKRYVIVTPIEIGDRCWEVEVTLTNRDSMAYRMLLGRQAIQEDMFVDPTSSFRQPRKSFRVYRGFPVRPLVRRPLRIGVLTNRPAAVSIPHLAAAAEARGHVLERLDVRRLSLVFDGVIPGCMADSAPLPQFDAIIPRIGAGATPFATAVLRQMQLMGAYAPNAADALDRLRNPLAQLQALIARRVATSGPAIAAERDDAILRRARKDVPFYRFLIAGAAVVAVIEGRTGTLRDASERELIKERKAALKAARALRLRLAAIELQRIEGRSVVVAASALPSLRKFSEITGRDVYAPIISDIEAHVRSLHHHAEPEAENGESGNTDAERTAGGT